MGILFELYDGFITSCENLKMKLDDWEEEVKTRNDKLKGDPETTKILETLCNRVDKRPNYYDDEDDDDGEDRGRRRKRH